MAYDTFPKCERISQDIVDTVAGISPDSGYNVELQVERYRKGGNVPDHLKAVVYEDDPRQSPDEDTPIRFQQWVRLYLIQIYVLNADEPSIPLDQILNIARADVEKALCVDRTRGGLAERTEIKDPLTESWDANEPASVYVACEVTYRHPEDDPYDLSTT